MCDEQRSLYDGNWWDRQADTVAQIVAENFGLYPLLKLSII